MQTHLKYIYIYIYVNRSYTEVLVAVLCIVQYCGPVQSELDMCGRRDFRHLHACQSNHQIPILSNLC
jgi:hypothetical protein